MAWIDRQITVVANADHKRLHRAGYNKIWNQWFKKNPDFSMKDLLGQMRSMRKQFNIGGGTTGHPRY